MRAAGRNLRPRAVALAAEIRHLFGGQLAQLRYARALDNGTRLTQTACFSGTIPYFSKVVPARLGVEKHPALTPGLNRRSVETRKKPARL
jgi:hypothetical protein